ncbi:MAG: hypothetical protein EOP19_03625 [Hyphomicrobiales bacterium]|nr:MAG: hypothetical protein EOP19_03625 [Hyphomicrobiales bacterium]
MATKEEEFKQRFAAVLLDLQQNGKNDPEAMWLLGSLACEIAEKSDKKTWVEFKRSMAQSTYSQLLTDFEKEGNRQHREGDRKKAYAIQVLAISLIARTQDDPQMRAGDALLDQMIDMTVNIYRDNREPKPAVN